MLSFEWDEHKNAVNQAKHQVSFEEAQTVFYDDRALVIDDPEHSQDEERFIILGMSARARLLIVCHCYRASDTVIRIISARKATKTESKYYV
ncbi:MAG: BrnT family toxin [Clostridia bacterium]|nr:BrnT family toxin [Clostridia bacterium]